MKRSRPGARSASEGVARLTKAHRLLAPPRTEAGGYFSAPKFSAPRICAPVTETGLLKVAERRLAAQDRPGAGVSSSLQVRLPEETTMMKALLWILLIIFIVGLLVVSGVLNLIF